LSLTFPVPLNCLTFRYIRSLDAATWTENSLLSTESQETTEQQTLSDPPHTKTYCYHISIAK
jgi:hypothetical protein